MVGLYHKYGRLITDARRVVFKISGDRFKFLDGKLVDARISATKRMTWFKDQYEHPQESKHTIGEVVGWLQKTGFAFVNSIPKARLFAQFSAREQLFMPQRLGNRIERIAAEVGMMFSGNRKGSFFVVIGRKV